MAADTPVSSAVAGRYFKTAIGFLALGLVLMLVLAIKRVVPEFLGGAAFSSYGRVVPAATALLLNGWLTIGLIGALFYIVSRSSRRDLGDGMAANGALVLLAAASLGGAAGILAGYTEGRRYLESILVFDLVALLGLLIVARSVIGIARRSDESSPVIWYSVASIVWLLLNHVVGNVPGVSGFAGQLQTSFYRSSLIGLWLASASVAIVYYALPRLAGRPPLDGTKISVLGVWSFGFVWAMTGPAELTFGAAGDWLETIGVLFSIALFLPLLIIATDLVQAMRGAWSNVRDTVALRFVMTGLGMLGVFAVLNLVQSLRASSAVVGFTDWVSAIEALVIFGPFTMILLGLFRLAAPDIFRGSPRPGVLGYRAVLVGLITLVGAMAVAGVQTGFTWAGAANSAEFSNFGQGWSSTLAPLGGNYVVQLVGLGVLALGLAASLRSVMGTGAESPAAPGIAAAEVDPELVLTAAPSVPKVLRYAVAFFVLAALVVLVLPSFESADPTQLADRSRTYRPGDSNTIGRAVYLQEGCAYCHTQQVRPIVTDVGLGAVSVPGDYSKETPVLIGVQRYGPDLMHLRLRSDFEAVESRLQRPREDRPWSIMPEYDYLSASDRAALVAYLVGEG
jgi:cbb3-type cytochrome oxidase subunit 1